MNEIWKYLLPSLVGIIPGILALYFIWKKGKAEAIKLTAETIRVEIDGKDIEDQITERVLERAKSHINGLSLENLDLKTQLDAVQRERVELAERVKQLEKKCVVMQAEYQAEYAGLLAVVNTLKDGICLLCEQLHEVGVEPAFVIEEAGGGD